MAERKIKWSPEAKDSFEQFFSSTSRGTATRPTARNSLNKSVKQYL